MRRSSGPGAAACATCCCSCSGRRRCCCWRSASRDRTFRAAPLLPEPPVTVVLADVSASMGGQARTARLRELVRAAIDAAPAGHAVGLVRFAATADVLVAPTLDRGAVKAAAAQLMPGFGPTMYRVGLARAAEVLGTKKGRVAVVTDLQSGGWTAGAGGGLPSGTEVDGQRRRSAASKHGDRAADDDARWARRSRSQYRRSARRIGQLRGQRRAARRTDGAARPRTARWT